ncbi:Zinc finger protein zas1 [Verticillium dahliae VDG1]|nr:Zinc finger protein zas1 [Verticillium dahliae VDG1]
MNWLKLVNDVQARQSDPTEALTTDQVVSEEFKYRFHTTVIQDKDLLNHAEPEKAEEYFQANGWEERESGARSAFFMYLDDETIDHLASAPDDQALARMTIDERCRIAWNHWVKIVEPMAPENEDDESGDEDRGAFLEVEDSQGRRNRQRRIRLLCLLSLYLASGDYSFDEIPNEGADCTRYANPQDETKAWCFISGISCETPPMIHGWLTELYGYKERETIPQQPYRPDTPAFLEDLRIWRENRTRKRTEADRARPPAPESEGDDARFKRAVAAIRRLTLVSVDHDEEAPHLDSPGENVPAARRRLVRETEVDQQTLETHWQEAAREVRLRGPPRFLKTDQILSEEFKYRFHNTLIEDQTVLDGGDVEQARIFYRESGAMARDNHPNLRSKFFIFLDEETLNHLSDVPCDDELDTMTLEERCRIASHHWVKVVAPLTEGLSETEDDKKQAAGRRRIRLIKLLPVYMRLLGVTGLEEVKLEEVAREDDTKGHAKQWCLIEGFGALVGEDSA